MQWEYNAWNIGSRYSQVSPLTMIKPKISDNIKPPTTIQYGTMPDPRLVKMGPPYPSSPVPYAKPCPSVQMPPVAPQITPPAPPSYYSAPSTMMMPLIGVGLLLGTLFMVYRYTQQKRSIAYASDDVTEHLIKEGMSKKDAKKFSKKIEDVYDYDDLDERMDYMEDVLSDLQNEYPKLHDELEDYFKDFV